MSGPKPRPEGSKRAFRNSSCVAHVGNPYLSKYRILVRNT